ncbi:hypothetical protein H0W80_04115, partial [Candidatus Saccharibacteria bacterium]|nr:hypothetical protein [Candidatus Saccharibacteria bacterium]
GWAAYDRTYSSYTGYRGTTISAVIRLDARGCHDQTATNGTIGIKNVSNISGFGPFVNLFGTWVASYSLGDISPGVSSIVDIPVSFVIDGSSHCFSWYGRGLYGGNDWRNSADGSWCFTVNDQGNPPPQQPANGNLIVTKYGAWEWNNICIRQDGQLATLACNWYSGVTKNNLNSSVRYNVQSQPTTSTTVLSGYRLNYYDGNGLHSCHAGEFPGATDSGLNGLYGLLCFGANIPGRTFSSFPVSSGHTTYLDLYYKDVPPVGNFENLSCDTTNERLIASGWAMDFSNTNKAIDVDLYYAGDDNGPGLSKITTTANGLGRAGENWAGISLNGHLFNAQLPTSLYDGNQHYVYAYAINIDKNGNKINKDNTFIGKRAITCTPRTKYYPWLQTQKGDVISTQNIIGQAIGTLPDLASKPGARHGKRGAKYTPFEKTIGGQNPEAYYVIAQGAPDNGASNHFCSGNKYTLGSSQDSQNEDCGLNGFYAMGNAENNKISSIKTALDKILLQNASNTTTCLPYKIRTLGTGFGGLLNGDLTLGCPGGAGLQIANGGYSLSGFFAEPNPTITGRGTLWVKGDLTIGKDIKYPDTGTYTDLNNLPNFAIFVEGNVTIDKSVTRIDAMIVSTGKVNQGARPQGINTCTQYSGGAGVCNEKLRINGLLASNGLILFERRIYSLNDPNNNPAENIVLTGQSIILPPPGFDSRDGGNAELQINSGELSPRLN